MSGPWYYGAAYGLGDDGIHRLHATVSSTVGGARAARVHIWEYLVQDKTAPVMGKLLVIALPKPPKKLRLIDWRP